MRPWRQDITLFNDSADMDWVGEISTVQRALDKAVAIEELPVRQALWERALELAVAESRAIEPQGVLTRGRKYLRALRIALTMERRMLAEDLEHELLAVSPPDSILDELSVLKAYPPLVVEGFQTRGLRALRE